MGTRIRHQWVKLNLYLENELLEVVEETKLLGGNWSYC